MVDTANLVGSVELTWLTVLAIIGIGFCAGWIDAVVGGGGLLQLPALLLVPGITPIQALATNKMGSVFGTTTSAITYYRRTQPDLKTVLPMAATALAASFGGAIIATILPGQVIKPIIVVALIAVATFTAARPQLGQATQLRHSGRQHYLLAVAIGAVVGFYDGVLGPGTGTFLIIGIVTILGYNFLAASAQAKIVNMFTNIGALIYFFITGHLLLLVGLLLGLANMVGGYLGARMAIAKGSGFIRIVFLIVVFALILRLGWDVMAERFF
ncbi:sulfite exporter TauE/SafE family protein [Micrococcoides hystricis]|uniref:Probable membrane transporter protein n=1 Tax=Micrococcoides hystricis TaxID=1572761 RepID=A0ABV6P8Q2_9MICC